MAPKRPAGDDGKKARSGTYSRRESFWRKLMAQVFSYLYAKTMYALMAQMFAVYRSRREAGVLAPSVRKEVTDAERSVKKAEERFAKAAAKKQAVDAKAADRQNPNRKAKAKSRGSPAGSPGDGGGGGSSTTSANEIRSSDPNSYWSWSTQALQAECRGRGLHPPGVPESTNREEMVYWLRMNDSARGGRPDSSSSTSASGGGGGYPIDSTTDTGANMNLMNPATKERLVAMGFSEQNTVQGTMPNLIGLPQMQMLQMMMMQQQHGMVPMMPSVDLASAFMQGSAEHYPMVDSNLCENCGCRKNEGETQCASCDWIFVNRNAEAKEANEEDDC